MKKKALKIITSILALLLLVGCGGNKESNNNDNIKTQENNSNDEKVLVYGSSDYTSINPALFEHGEINSLLFNGLTGRDKDNNIIPALAESWEYDDESLTYTFKLRDDVKWHDGEQFTADDVKFTYETINNPDVGSEISTNYEDIEKMEIVNDYEIKITLKDHNIAILDYFTVGIIPKHLLEGKDIVTADFNLNPIGTGPYKLSEWDEGQSITLVKNEDYFKNTPKIDKVIFKIVDDSKAKVMQLKSGELNLAQVTPKDIDTFKNNSDFVVNIMKTADYRGILYNFNSKFFSKYRELPNALSYGIDRQAIVDSILLGYGKVAYSPLQAGEYVNEDIEKFEYNPGKAKELLEKNGWKLGDDGIYEKDGTKLSFELVCPEGDQVRVDMANFSAQQLKEIGVDVNVAVKAKVDWEKQDSYLIGWGSPFDPDDHTYKVFSTNGGANYSSYSNSKIDDILTKARQTDVFEERLKYYKEFQEEMTKDMPYTFLAYIDAIYVATPNLKGITTDTILGHHGVGIFWNVEEWDLE
ncbi:Oligopeptide-binding protein AppA precursor [uncultured Clostridium sp.]|uniref:ABC transporter substrate-binding protein n=1 Tax=uncultured Clostridium sp. TaxID=59620 RepID=UPI000821A623|nr:ABC transporter substrate-binding protein [uncultured Clostridium sp.]SCK04021.1 Oligopeptide-binding protein AppA precursor [uncultured Clostridium sp.]